MKSIYKIVLTGGPCAGKTSMLDKLKNHYTGKGWNVLIVPESATILLNGCFKKENSFHLQSSILELQKKNESLFSIEAELRQNTLIIHDRGLMDGKAFCDNGVWEDVTAHEEEVYLRDLYDMVIHLETAAIGAPEYYTLKNNSARTESQKQAIETDQKIKAAWLGTPKLKIVPCEKTIEKKAEKVIQLIDGLLSGIEIERQFLVSSFTYQKWPTDYVDLTIYQAYTNFPVKNTRVRARGEGSSLVFTQTIKNPATVGNFELEWNISERDYTDGQLKRIPGTKILEKTRRCFLWENKYFELDIFKHNNLKKLEIELVNLRESFFLPPFISIDREITGLPEYSNSYLAKI